MQTCPGNGPKSELGFYLFRGFKTNEQLEPPVAGGRYPDCRWGWDGNFWQIAKPP